MSNNTTIDSSDDFHPDPDFDPDATIEQSETEVDAFRAIHASSTPLPESIGKYRILSEIGEGGMGTVYEAEQDSPRRKVALKVIKAGVVSKNLLLRFEIEAQILGKLDHPGIATIFEAGTFDEGHGKQPFFAMEFVQGALLTDYADAKKLGTRDRLSLLAKIADAVQHAHQKGVIHRDLKPGNILVTDEGQIKILDFGVARVTDADIQTVTMQTDIGQLIGTIPYMSPEQASGNPDDLDTRSDVYALGIIGYELLTGQMPYDVKQKMIHEAVRVIREDEPKPLSSINKTFRGDVEIIVGKALIKEKDRRYQSASDLASDIHRYLNNEPIEARPPSTWYHLSKFSRRNKALVAGVIAVLVVSVVGALVSINFAMGEAEQKRIAIQAAEDARVAEENTQRELTRANEIKKLITEMLQSINPEEAKGADITLLKGILDDASARLKNGKITDELVAAELHDVIGGVYISLGLYSESEEHYPVMLEIHSRLLGDQHYDTLASMSILAALHHQQDRHSEAEQLYLKALDGQRSLLGEDDQDTLQTMTNLSSLYRIQGRYDEAEPLIQKVLEIHRRLHGNDSPLTLRSMANLATEYLSSGRWSEAEELYLQALEGMRRVVGDKDPDTLFCANCLASLYLSQGRYDEAEKLVLEWIEIVRHVYGQEHPSTLNMLMTLSNVYGQQERLDESQEIILQSLEINRRTLGEEHSATLTSMINLALNYLDLGKYDESETIYLQVLKIQRSNFGEDDPSTLVVMNNLAILYSDQGRYAEAEALNVETIEINRRVMGEEHPDTLGSISNLGYLYNSMERYEDAAELFELSLPAKRRVLGNDHPWTLIAMLGLAESYKALGRHDDAEPLYVERLEIQERVMGVGHHNSLESKENLVYFYQALGRFFDAESHYLTMIETQRRVLGAEHTSTLGSMTNLGLMYIEIGRHGDSARMLEMSLPIMRRVLGMQHQWTANAIWGLAESYSGLGKFEESSSLFRELLAIETASAESPDADVQTLNAAAWTLLTHELEALRNPAKALVYAERACALEAAEGGTRLWMFLDTLALAQFLTGDIAAAVETQRRTLLLMPEGANPLVPKNLAKYESALESDSSLFFVDD